MILNEEVQDNFLQISDIPALIIAATGDENTYKSSGAIFNKAKNDKTRLLSYKGDAHGIPLFKQDSNLENTMVAWFKDNLN